MNGASPPDYAVFASPSDYWRAYAASLSRERPRGPLPVHAADPGPMLELLSGPPAAPRAAVPGTDVDWLPTDAALGDRLHAIADGYAELDLVAADAPVAEAARARSAVPERRDRRWIVGVGGWGAALACARAADDGRSVLSVAALGDSRVLELARTARSLYVIAPDVTQQEVVDLVDAVTRAGRERPDGACPLGFMRAGSLAVLTLLDAKQRLARTRSTGPWRDVLLDATAASAEGEDGVSGTDELVVLDYRRTDRDTIIGLGPVRLFALTSHGMSDLVHLNNDYLCGRSSFLVAPVGDRLPSCAADGALCLHKQQGRPLRAHDLAAEHLFVNSCGSLRFTGSEFGEDFDIWYAALEGHPRSVVGTMRWKDGHGLEGVLYQRLLASGHSLGRAVGILNAVLPGHELENSPVYALIGDPDEQVADPAPPSAPIPLQPGSTIVQLAGGLARCTIDDPELIGAFTENQLLVHVSRRPSLAISVVPRPAEPVLDVLLADTIGNADPFTVQVSDFRAEARRLRALRRAIAGTLDAALGITGMHPDRVRQGMRANLENRMVNVARLMRRRLTEPAATGRLWRAYNQLVQEVAAADAATAQWLHERLSTTSFRFSENYQDVFRLGPAQDDERCARCGSVIAVRTLHHLLDPGVQRTERICHECGGLEDTPDSSLGLELQALRTARRGARFDVCLTVRNDTDDEIEGQCLAAVRRGSELGVTDNGSCQPLRVPPREQVAVRFGLRFAETAVVHQYDLQAVVVASTRVFMARVPLWLR